MVVADERQALLTQSRGQGRGLHDAVLAGRDVDIDCRSNESRVARGQPSYPKLLAARIAGIADANFGRRIRRGGVRLFAFQNQLQAGIRGLFRLDGLKNKFDASRPFVSLQAVQMRAFLQIANHHDLADRTALLVARGALFKRLNCGN